MDVREALLRATVRIFAEVGSRGATTRRIAQEAGVNEVTLFRHFATKDDLIREALRWSAERASAPALPVEPVDPPAELADWCRNHYRQLYRLRSLIRKSMGEFEEHPDLCERAMKVSADIANELTGYLVRLQKKSLATTDWDPRAAAAMLLAAIFTDAIGRDTMPERFPFAMRDAVETYLSLFFRSIGVGHQRPVPAHPTDQRTS